MLRELWAAFRARVTSGRGSCALCGTQTLATLDGARFCGLACQEDDAWAQANGG